MTARRARPRPPAVVRYKHTESGRIATYAKTMPRLERSSEWRRCDAQGRVGTEFVKAEAAGTPIGVDQPDTTETPDTSGS